MNLFARPSVNIDLCKVSTPVAAPRQPSICSGFPSGENGKKSKCSAILADLPVALSSESGFSLKAVSAADSGLCLRRFDYRQLISSTAALLSPCSRPVLVTGPAFYGSRS